MPDNNEQLEKSLTLFDVYVISTGAMFSSGFFLLPGLATAYAGPSTILAYLLAGILVLPAMFSKAELCTAMPKAGGTYYFLDRSLGPLAGTVGGLGTWLALVFKSAFALVGMGAYLVLFFDVPIKPLAIALTAAFTALNVFGAKETSTLQRILVTVLLAVLLFFAVQGLFEVLAMDAAAVDLQMRPFFAFGVGGFISTVGMVFVSYAGLTKVASVAEEVKNPDRNIPLGMILSLATATVIYVLGVLIMVSVLPADALREDLTPVATAGEAFFSWLPEPYGLGLIVAAAIAAFASTGNAGILSASRYPLAMARDHLVPERFGKIGKFSTPMAAILATAGLMLVFILAFSAEGVAKLASAFSLLVFGLINLSVIVMRESGIPSYAPGYRSPLYPWMQIFGIVVTVVLITTMGLLSILFTAGVIVLSIAWYVYYARDHVNREGAIYHLFARLGKARDDGLDDELEAIVEQKEIDDEDAPFDELVAQAHVIDLDRTLSLEALARQAADALTDRYEIDTDAMTQRLMERAVEGVMPVAGGAALLHDRSDEIEEPALVLVRCRSGVCVNVKSNGRDATPPLHAILFLVSPRSHPRRHLRSLSTLARRMDEASFIEEWRAADNEQALKETLLHHERYLSLQLLEGHKTEAFIGKPIKDIDLPARVLVALVRRGNDTAIVPGGSTVLEAGDRLTVIGEPASIDRLYELYRERPASAEDNQGQAAVP